MLQINKIRTFSVTLIVILSSFSVLLYPTPIKATNDIDDLNSFMSLDDLWAILESIGASIDFDNILTMHPYRYVAVWQPNDTYNIKGEMDFNLFVSSSIMDYINILDLDLQDKIDVSLYHISGNNTPEKIKEKKGTTLDVGSLDIEKTIRPISIKMDNLDLQVDSEDYLLFGIQVNHTNKPLSSFAAKRLTKFLDRIIEFSLESDILVDILIDNDIIENREDIEPLADDIKNFTRFIGEEELESVVNTIMSSAFYYGSQSYNSNVEFSSNSGDNFTLYFRKEGDMKFESKFFGENILNEYISGLYKIANKTAPVSEEHQSWPPRYLIDGIFEETEFSDFSSFDVSNIDEDAFFWLGLWFLYTFKGEYEDIKNSVFLYLKNNEEMNSKLPDAEVIRERILNSSLKWTSPSFERNKIIRNASAELYIHYPYPSIIPFGDIDITATLYDGDEKIDHITKKIEGTTLLGIFNRGPDTPTTFNFEIENYEITYDNNLRLEVSSSASSFLNLRPIYLLYNSEDYPSHLKYIYKETEHIDIKEINSENVYAGGSVNFDMKISSNYSDSLDINIEEKISEGPWEISWIPKKINVKKESDTLVTITVKSDATDESAYDNDYITLYFNVSGKTGIDSKTETIRVEKNKVEYDLELIIPDEKFEIKHGENKTFNFKIRNKNTGFLRDSYGVNVSSENNLFNSYFISSDKEVSVYNTDSMDVASVDVKVYIPKYTNIDSDKLILNILSGSSGEQNKEYNETYTIEIDIITPNIFESIYHLFERLSDRIGLDDALGDDESLKDMGAWILISIFVIILLIIILMAILIIRRKFVEIICLKRIKEIKADEKAVFEITIKNPYKKRLSYRIKTHMNKKIKDRWDVELERQEINIEAKKSEKIKLIVEPTDNVKAKDWAKITITAKPIDKRKKIKIDTITVIKDSEIDVSISGVLHWPKTFKKGDRIETSFKLFNKGKVSAEKITIFLYINGIQKNKVEDITIPVGGYADIEIPWIAEKGKNEIEIIIK